MTAFTQDQWIIIALVFVLGILLGVFLTAGGRKKWKTRYHDERSRLEAREREFDEREKHWASQEKEWRERDSLRAAAVRGRGDPADDRPL
jgi:uncharacterized membrane-anchored protein YhcB (DUF1043 family)